MNTTETLRNEVQKVLTDNILSFWLDNMQDRERGGWYGRMTGDYTLVKDAPRGAVLYARLLWTFSSAWKMLHKVEYLHAATMTRNYIFRHFVDREYGGTYWSLNADGSPLDTRKQFYAQGFMIYGLSEYASATNDRHSLQLAQQLYDYVEKHAWDGRYGGYIEAVNRDGTPIEDMRLSEKDENAPKSQNTHLHIIEAYTSLYMIAPDERLRESLRRLVGIFRTHIINPHTHHLDLFFNLDWTPLSADFSTGHDIECSWLIHEAVTVLKEPALLSDIETTVNQLAQASEEIDWHCWSQWWEYAEAIVGYVNLYQMSADDDALRKAFDIWTYVRQYVIDWQHGEWFWSVNSDGRPDRTHDHAGFWKCPYHNGRMCLEIIKRF